jgi:DNA repair exonuclease SbcCD ATPase subunit
VIRDQIDREMESKPKEHPAEIALRHAERINGDLKARCEQLEAELDKARKHLELARSERDFYKSEVKDRDEVIESNKEAYASVVEYAGKMRRSWQKASNLLRMMPLDLVNKAREPGEHRKGVE